MRKVFPIAALVHGSYSGNSNLTAATSILNHPPSSVGKEFDGYRIWTTGDMLDDYGVSWFVKDLKLYNNLNCTGPNYNGGTPVDSGHASSDGPEYAFDANNVSWWQGILNNEDDEWWVGMVYDSPREVLCLSYLDLGLDDDGYSHGANKFKIEARESSSSIWREIMIVEEHQSGQRQDIPLNSLSPYPSSVPSPSSLPSMAHSHSHSNSKSTTTTTTTTTTFASSSVQPSSSSSSDPLTAPSKEASITPSIYCDDNETPITVQIDLTTSYPSEISWNVTNIFTNQTVFEGGSYTNADVRVLNTTLFSVCPQDCLQLTIYDSVGDGLSSDLYEDGSYQVYYDDVLVHEGGGNFGFNETTTLFGAGCPSTGPSTSSGPTFSTEPSTSPSLSKEPSSEPSSAPSSIPSYPPSLSSAPSSAPSPGPSSSPTSAPSMSSAPSTKSSSTPSFAPSNTPSNTPSVPLCTMSASCTGVLAFFGLNPDCLLSECAGHCHVDSDCAADLYCFRRHDGVKNDSIPGCETVPYGTVNYCVAREFQPSDAPSRLLTTEPSRSPTLTVAPTEKDQTSAWTQFGNAIHTQYSYFSMAADRLIVAVRESESVHIYRLDDESMLWTLIADAINPGFTSIDEPTYSLALSSDGGVVAIGDAAHDSYRGRVQIFAAHPNRGWVQLGLAIAGESPGDYAGESLALSADGTAVAITAHRNDGNKDKSGHVRMFAYSILSKDWLQQGEAINGEANEDYLGTSVDMSTNGSVVAIGAGFNDGNGRNSGHVRTFEFSVQNQIWVQRGKDLNGEASNDLAGGNSVAISKDGSVIAIGAIYNGGNGYRAGHVRVFEYNTTREEDWVQRGGNIDGEAVRDWSGYSVDISADGTAIVIGAPYNSGNGNQAGHLRVYDFNEHWVQRGVDLDGDTQDDQLGTDVAMSADGKVVGCNGFNTKNLRVMKWTSFSSSPSSMPSSTPNCANDKALLRFDLTTDRFPKQTTWDVKNSQDETVLSGGPYDEMFTFHSESYCLNQGCYQFAIQDLSSDGICCDWFAGNGKYKLYFDSVLVQEGGNFTSEEISIPIGKICPSPSPSISSKPSLQPTLSMQPSEFPSTEPSNQPSTGPTISHQPSTIPSSHPTAACPVGTYSNSSIPKCQPCSPGSYQDEETYSNTCKKCETGSYQPEEGMSKCIPCGNGTFQEAIGQAQCKECRAGGYCSAEKIGTCDGGFTPCPIGTFNGVTGATNATSCLPCPTGTFSDNKEGLVQCLQCPYRLSSEPNNTVCSFCAKDFYLKMATVDSGKLNKEPNDFCLACPVNAKCDRNTTIKTLKGNTNFWRDSLDTQKYYACENSNGCQGNNSCAEGYQGILCELCVDENKYVNYGNGKCTDCPRLLKLGRLPCIMVLIVIMIVMAHIGAIYFPVFKHYLGKLSTFLTRLRMQAKFKMVISFFQVFLTFKPIYGVHMHSAFTSWFNFLEVFNFGFAELFAIPGPCIGSMKIRLLVTATWPYAIIILIVGGILLQNLLLQTQECNRREVNAKFWSCSLHVTIIIFYLVLPSISRSIFDAKICRSFASNDVDELSTSHLIADWSLTCDDKTDKEYVNVLRTFWAVFVVWPIGVPLMFLVLLLYIHGSMKNKRITPLAEACRFLWGDYKDRMILWELVDVFRKISLTGLIILIDTEEGSERTLRLHIGAVICIFYTGVLAIAQPYRENDDLYVGVITNMLLTCCFIVGIIIHGCKEDDDESYKTCEQTFGLSLNPYRATIFAVILTASELLVSTSFVLVLAVNVVNAPAIYLTSTNCTPRLDMPKDCKYHMFVSHIWSTGQDKVHKIVRMLQLYVPELIIWLDVDILEDLSDLEASVSDAAHFVLFYSKGFFRSKNCCREVIRAMEKGKPITVLYEADDNMVDVVSEMKRECKQFWPSQLTVDNAVAYIFAKDPIMWVSTGIGFSLESIKLVVGRLLETLPYYENENNTSLLVAGLKIDGEVGPVKILEPVEILYCSTSTRAHRLVDKLKKECGDNLSASIINLSSNNLDTGLSARMIDISDYAFDLNIKRKNKKTVMLLYLNEETFHHPDNLEYEIVKRSIDEDVQVVLMHEKDTNEGGCPFNEIVAQTPQDLMEDPYYLYNRMAVNIYWMEGYQQVSLRQILRKMGAVPIVT